MFRRYSRFRYMRLRCGVRKPKVPAIGICLTLWAALIALGTAEAASVTDDGAPNGAVAEGTPSPTAFSPGSWVADLRDARQRLQTEGFTLGFQEQSELWANLRGGGHQGTSYNGLTTAKLDVDLSQAFGWHGAEFLAEAFDIHGPGPTRSLVGNQQIVSNIEAIPSIKLYDL